MSNLRHGKNGTKVYFAWRDMKARCLRRTHAEYRNYGGRGISVCGRWLVFEHFYADMGDPPTDKHSIERLDVNGNYTPENCRWATKAEQDNNKRNTRRLTAFGETKSVAQWAKDARCRVGINTLRARLRRGIPLHIAIS